DEDIILVNVQADSKMFDADKDLGGEELFVEQEVVAYKEKINEVTLAQALAELKTSKPKAKGDVIQEPSKSPITTTTIPKQKSQDNGKGILNIEQSWCKDKKKRAKEELIQKSEKKQKAEDNKETAELKKLMEIIIDKEEVEINAIPLDVKSLGIVDWKIYKEGKKSYYQIIRADGKSQMYMFFSQMLTSFDTEDLEDLYKLVKAEYGSTSPVEDLDLLLWGDLKTMFKSHVEDVVWRKKQGYKVLEFTTAGTRVKTVSESYYCQYKEVIAAQVEYKVNAAEELQLLKQ
nr:hypothetical protein [Tanacetum cinerariifolium]